jgi:hypothetical protein
MVLGVRTAVRARSLALVAAAQHELASKGLAHEDLAELLRSGARVLYGASVSLVRVQVRVADGCVRVAFQLARSHSVSTVIINLRALVSGLAQGVLQLLQGLFEALLRAVPRLRQLAELSSVKCIEYGALSRDVCIDRTLRFHRDTVLPRVHSVVFEFLQPGLVSSVVFTKDHLRRIATEQARIANDSFPGSAVWLRRVVKLCVQVVVGASRTIESVVNPKMPAAIAHQLRLYNVV